jgi:hypothetical protein
MSESLNSSKALIFRATHVDNLRWILEHGLHARNGAAFDPNFRNIGNLELMDKRATRVVPVSPGGTLSDYVPFYFTPFSIMMFNIKTGHGVAKVPNHEIVILVSGLRQVADRGIPFAFTNQHAYPRMAQYFNELTHLDQIDWPILQNRDFKHDPDDPGKKERYQAEALIWKHLPLNALDGVCCYTKPAAEQVEQLVRNQGLVLKTIVRPGWYF